MTHLRNPSLKPRHWSEIEQVLEYEFTSEDPITLRKLEEIEAFDRTEEIEEISGKASSEASLEAILKKVRAITRRCINQLLVFYPGSGVTCSATHVF